MPRYLCSILLPLFACLAVASAPAEPPPPIDREFRAAWIATVANIDWPSKPGLSTAKQKDELRNLLSQAKQIRLNAIVLQVRPACDAIYPSSHEPWSEYLTGAMGQPPAPFYDPLEFAIDEAHARGLELHAWFNPYRALHPSAKSPISAGHVSHVKPDIVRQYGKHLWLDPGEPAAAQHSLDVIIDVVKRYDVDGIHFDDYFYPYPIDDEAGKRVPFPDEQSWNRRSDQDAALARDDWRRASVNRLVARLYRQIKDEKPHVKFGISPFGIYRPGNPEQIKGFDQYATLYADPLKWWHEGTLDYLTPQLYWKIAPPAQSYPALLAWWHQENKQQRHLWPGNFTSKLIGSGSAAWPVEELIAQIWVTRAQAGATGNVHFSMKALTKEYGTHGLEIKRNAYRKPALVPASPWLAGDAPLPSRPTLIVNQTSPTEADAERKVVAKWSVSGPDPWLWVVQSKRNGTWFTQILPGNQEERGWQSDRRPQQIALRGVDRFGRLGPLREIVVIP